MLGRASLSGGAVFRSVFRTLDKVHREAQRISNGWESASPDVIDWHENAQAKASDHLYDVVWHNLGKVRCMYKTVLEVKFPSDMDAIFKAVIVRHDLVHRNGKTKGGSLHRFKQSDLKSVFSKIEAFISLVDEQVKEKEWFSQVGE